MIEVAPRVLVGAWRGTGISYPSGAAVQFGQYPTSVDVSETATVSVSYTIIRSIDLTSACSVEWALGGTLTSEYLVDGQALSGALNFAAGVENQVVTVQIAATAAGLPDKSLTIALSNADNCRIAGPTTVSTLAIMPRSGVTLVVRGDSYLVTQGTVDVLTVLDNDEPATGVTIASIGAVAQGSARRVQNSTAIEYTAPADGGFTGQFSFTYTASHAASGETATGTVSITVQSAFAVVQDSISIERGKVREIDVLANDTGPDTITAVTQPAKGSVKRTQNNTRVEYTAPPTSSNFTGSDNFTYTAKETATNKSETATVSVSVTAPGVGWRGGAGPNSKLPWFSGTAQTGKDLEGIRGKKSDCAAMFGGWGKGSDSVDDGWDDLKGGTITGNSIKLDGCFSGFNGRSDSKSEWVNDSSILPIWAYHVIPAAVNNNNLTELRGYYNNVADGDYDDTIYSPMVAKLRRIMLNYGYTEIIIRYMHEQNGNHYSHSVMGQYDEFIAAFRHIAAFVKANIGNGLAVYTDLNCGKNSNGGTISPDHWPGDDCVDILSVDYYDRNMNPNITSLANFNTVAAQTKNRSTRFSIGGLYGIKTYLDFAKARGKKLGVAEWGCMLDGTHPGAYGDNPEFINGMFQFFTNNAAFIAYECYFNQSDSRLSQHPLARAKYRELWGA